jgi:hypothetical protein
VLDVNWLLDTEQFKVKQALTQFEVSVTDVVSQVREPTNSQLVTRNGCHMLH